MGRASLYLKTTSTVYPVPGPLATVEVSPVNDTVKIGTARQYVAIGYDAQGRVISNTVPTWQSTNTTAATVSSGGFVTGAGTGVTTIKATINGKIGTSPATVVPDTLSITATGNTLVNPAGAQCDYVASVYGAAGAASIKWYVNGTLSGSGSHFTNFISSNRTISAVVTDALSRQATSTLNVVRSSSGTACFF